MLTRTAHFYHSITSLSRKTSSSPGFLERNSISDCLERIKITPSVKAVNVFVNTAWFNNLFIGPKKVPDVKGGLFAWTRCSKENDPDLIKMQKDAVELRFLIIIKRS